MYSNEDQNPFKVLHNYRSTSTRSSKVSKKNPIRKTSDPQIQIPIKKPRKMTQNIQVNNRILEEDYFELDWRGAYSEAEMPHVNSFSLENCQISDLDRLIPMNLQQSALDNQSPLERGKLKQKNLFQEEE